MTQKKYVIGNWKMNGDLSSVKLAQEINSGVDALKPKNTAIGICPPFTLIGYIFSFLKDTILMMGAQDCHYQPNGAHTGDISALMLSQIGVGLVLVGHSERRANHAEIDATVSKKAKAAIENNLLPVICVGETLEERESGTAIETVLNQVQGSIPADANEDQFIIAYEPVWAIGTGKVAEPSDILEMHAKIREYLGKKFNNAQTIPLLYGGSVNASNASAILHLDNVDGALVGGASLKSADFLEIIKAAEG